MPRDLPIGNDHFLVNFDANYNLREIFFPHVGMENHTAGRLCRTGVWASGRFAWIDDPAWQKTANYMPQTLATAVTARHPGLSVEIVFHDAVDIARNILVREVNITNTASVPQSVRLFFHYDFSIYGVDVGDTIYYEPQLKALIAYKGQRYFLMAGQRGGTGGVHAGINAWATGIREFNQHEGTWRDAEDGELSGNPIAQGSVDTTMALNTGPLDPGEQATLYHWLVAGNSLNEVRELHNLTRFRGPRTFLYRTVDYWRAWINKNSTDFGNLRQEMIDLYQQSLLIMRTQADCDGGIMAANDWDVIKFNRDTYSYVWPRDGAIVSMAFDRAGYQEVTQRFFNFCARVIDRQGYLLQRFDPRGDMASGWHPWVNGQGQPQLPIQEDETGLVIHALWEHYALFRDIEFISPLYRPLIKTAADFLCSYREPNTGLPAPSYDLWEERHTIHAFTVAAVWAGLTAAARFTALFNEVELSQKYTQAATEIHEATLRYLFDESLGRFLRGITVAKDGVVQKDLTLDSSLAGMFKFGMFPAHHPAVEKTMEAVRQRLWCKTAVGGLARYENDYYHQVSRDIANVPGNPWFICTLWLAQYYIERAQTPQDLEPALELLHWVRQHALPSGVLAEQLNPDTGAPLSVSPLTWSHAEFVLAIHQYLEKVRAILWRPQSWEAL